LQCHGEHKSQNAKLELHSSPLLLSYLNLNYTHNDSFSIDFLIVSCFTYPINARNCLRKRNQFRIGSGQAGRRRRAGAPLASSCLAQFQCVNGGSGVPFRG
jgi:hypothetical protein